ncbi:MAG: hypothetical protein R3C49_17260 [Planctomycetaceae bacterium]
MSQASEGFGHQTRTDFSQGGDYFFGRVNANLITPVPPFGCWGWMWNGTVLTGCSLNSRSCLTEASSGPATM